MEIKIGETKGRVTSNVSKEDKPRVLLRLTSKFRNKSDEVPFDLPEDLKRDEEIRVTIVKISESPKAEGGEEATAETG
jgi:hypothetical protein